MRSMNFTKLRVALLGLVAVVTSFITWAIFTSHNSRLLSAGSLVTKEIASQDPLGHSGITKIVQAPDPVNSDVAAGVNLGSDSVVRGFTLTPLLVNSEDGFVNFAASLDGFDKELLSKYIFTFKIYNKSDNSLVYNMIYYNTAVLFDQNTTTPIQFVERLQLKSGTYKAEIHVLAVPKSFKNDQVEEIVHSLDARSPESVVTSAKTFEVE